jgi:hypothetical protein
MAELAAFLLQSPRLLCPFWYSSYDDHEGLWTVAVLGIGQKQLQSLGMISSLCMQPRIKKIVPNAATFSVALGLVCDHRK